MKKKLLLILMLANVSLVSYAAGPKVPYTHKGFYTNEEVQKAVHFVSVEDIKESLKNVGPINVSFDVDDTLLFSSQYFQYGFNFMPEAGSNPGEVLKSPIFWDYIAEQGDQHSIPKKSAKELIKMHLERGDHVYFITGRTHHSKQKNFTPNKLSKTLMKYFNLPTEVPVEYTSETPLDGYKYDKSYYIKKHNVKIHYGDSDNDILAAWEVGARGIRVQRPYNSTNRQNMNGGYGEEVLINSAW